MDTVSKEECCGILTLPTLQESNYVLVTVYVYIHNVLQLRNYCTILFNYSNMYPIICNFTHLILFGKCSTCFGWYHHPPSRAETTVCTASGICHTVNAICRYGGRVGTGMSVLWVAYATHNTLKPVPTFPR